MIWRACTLVSYLKEKLRERNWLQSQFLAWREVVQWKKREALLQKKAESWHAPLLLLALRLYEFRYTCSLTTSIT